LANTSQSFYDVDFTLNLMGSLSSRVLGVPGPQW
jgi:hypothetical protein